MCRAVPIACDIGLCDDVGRMQVVGAYPMLTIHCIYFQMRESLVSLVSHGADLHVCSASLFVALE